MCLGGTGRAGDRAAGEPPALLPPEQPKPPDHAQIPGVGFMREESINLCLGGVGWARRGEEGMEVLPRQAVYAMHR